MKTESLSADVLHQLDACWRAANYLSVGQIYLLDNPLLTEPLRVEHVKPRLLGHWGTTQGLNFIYAHLNRVSVVTIWMCLHRGPGTADRHWSRARGWKAVTPSTFQTFRAMAKACKNSLSSFVSRWRRQSRYAGNTGIDSRRR